MRCLLLFILFGFISGFCQAEKPVTYKDFSHLPLIESVKISPDGKSLAFLKNIENNTLVVTVDIETSESYIVARGNSDQYKVRWIEWPNNDHIVFSVMYADRRASVGSYETRLMIADKHSNSASFLIKPRKAIKGESEHVAQFQDDVISWLPDDPSHILVSADFDGPIYPSVYKVNLYDKSRKRIRRPKEDVVDWGADQQGRVRIGSVYDIDTGVRSAQILDIDGNKWNKLWEREAFDPPYIPLGFGLDPHILFLRADFQGRGAIYSMDTRHPDQPPTLKFSDPRYDIQGGLIYSAKAGDAIGVYHDQAKGGRLYWDPRYQALQGGIDRALPDAHNDLVGWSNDEQRYILFSSSSESPGTYFLGDRAKKTLTPILYTYPQLRDVSLVPKRLVELAMRDGLKIEAYLTLPAAGSEQKGLPAVIYPHGGPISRDHSDFDYWTQFFASRGLAVLQPNFRGSSGYGHAFMTEAVGNYGLGMQDDVVDATKWLIAEGIVDPKRICIVGSSYGGYAALTASFKTPELFQCAISFAGVSDLVEQRHMSNDFVNRAVAYKQYGEDTKQLKANSAYYNVDKIKTPILLIHGGLDRIVLPMQSRKLAAKLQEEGKTYKYIELEMGSHELSEQKNRAEVLSAMDEFLTHYLHLSRGNPP